MSIGKPTKTAASVSFEQKIDGNLRSRVSHIKGAGAAFRIDT